MAKVASRACILSASDGLMVATVRPEFDGATGATVAAGFAGFASAVVPSSTFATFNSVNPIDSRYSATSGGTELSSENVPSSSVRWTPISASSRSTPPARRRSNSDLFASTKVRIAGAVIWLN